MIRVAVIGGTDCLECNMTLVSKYSDYDILLISYMSCTSLAKYALGTDVDFETAFLKNKPVYVLKKGLQYKKISDKILYKMYCAYMYKLKSFGVKFIDSVSDIRIDKK